MPSRERALVTGSTRGIGLAIAEALGAAGFDLVLNFAANHEAAERAIARVREVCPNARHIRADVTDARDVARLIADAESDGPIDLLVNNVGAFLLKPFLDTSMDEWHSVLKSNLTSTVLCCREILPAMRTRRRGRIVNIASLHADAIKATPHTLPYAIANAGIVRLTVTLAKTEGPHGIRVNAVCPGFVSTEEAHNPDGVSDRIPLRRLADAREIASVVAFLASSDASYLTGAVINVHGGALL